MPLRIAHGCVVTLITYASTVQGTELANCGLAAFYARYTLSALTFATVFVRQRRLRDEPCSLDLALIVS